MKSDRWSLIEEIFQGALERPPSERKRYVETACENDKELLFEIESLLENDDDAERVLRSLIEDDLKEAAQTSNLQRTGATVLGITPRTVRDISENADSAITWLG